MRGFLGHLTRRTLIVVVALTALLAVIATVTVSRLGGPARTVGVPVPSPILDAETWSNGVHLHHPVPLGVLTPVDLDGDVLPDVNVLVDFLDANGVANPPDLSTVVAPHIQILRDTTAITLGRPSPPLKIQINLSLIDSSTLRTATRVGLGYDTDTGGSIPPHFSMVAQGLSSFFNPLTAQVDTSGTILAGGLTGPTTYEGPLDVIGHIEQVGSTTADASLAYKPWPGAVTVKYSNDNLGQHINYLHASAKTIDLISTVTLSTAAGPFVSFQGRVDRLPPAINLDLLATQTSGDILYQAHSSGRHPDISAQVTTTGPTGAPLVVKAAVEGLPLRMHATWSTPPFGPVHAAFDASGEGAAAVEATIQNYLNNPTALTPYVPPEQQYLNYQQDTAGEQYISARLERLRSASFDSAADGFTTNVQVGDGELPVIAHVALDGRSGSTGALLEASSTVAPLPSNITVQLHAPAATVAGSTVGAGAPAAAGPVTAIYDASEETDVDAHVSVVPAGATNACAADHTLCGDLKIRHIPAHIQATFGNIDQYGQGVDIVDTPRTVGTTPDFFGDVTLGTGVLTSPSDPNSPLAANSRTPLVGHAELLGFPPSVRVRALTHATTGDLSRAEYHACWWDFAAKQCGTNPSGVAPNPLVDTIGAVSFSLRDFTADNRPANIPPPTPATTGNFAWLVARQARTTDPLRFEGAGKVTHIAHVVLANHDGLLGVHTEIGGGLPLSVHADADIPALSLLGDATVAPLPATFDFCMRREGSALATSSDGFSQPCEAANPFSESRPLQFSPMALAYRATAPSSTFNITGKVSLRQKGTSSAQDQIDKVSIAINNLPLALTAQIRTMQDCPSTGACLPLRGLYSAPAPNGQQIRIDLSGSHSIGDAICEDPRTGVTAQCAAMSLVNLPDSVNYCYDPSSAGQCDASNADNNLAILTGGAHPMDITGIEVSDTHPDTSNAGHNKVIVVTGPSPLGTCPGVGACITGLPSRVTGQIKANAVEIDASPALGQVDAVARNYIAPDPINFGIPAQRAGLPAATQQFTALGRGDLLKVTAHLQNLRGAGYRTQVDASGKPLESKVVTLDFDGDQAVRAYADVQLNNGNQGIGDVTISDLPQGMVLCFRGKDAALTPAVIAGIARPTWCDTSAAADRGAFQFAQHHAAATAGHLLGIHAFVRAVTGGGTSVLSGTADIDGIPPIVQGQFGGAQGGADVGGFAADAVTRQGIKDIRFHVANFDLTEADSGYTSAPRPQFVPRRVSGGPFPAQTKPNQSFLSVAADDAHFEAVGDIGASGAHLQHVVYQNANCAKPTVGSGADDATGINRADYPYYPAVDSTTSYQCIRADFEKGLNPVTQTTVNPIYLFADVEQGDSHIALANAGLSDVPRWVQITLAKTATTDPSDPSANPLRRRCGAAGSDSGSCMPPLVRFDSAVLSPAPSLFGTVELSKRAGGNADLQALRSVQPKAQFPSGYFEQDMTSAGATGVRAKIGTFNPPAGSTEPSRTAVAANFRFLIPGSLTVDQVQSWGKSDAATPGDYFDASDTRFHYVTRDYTQTDPYTTSGAECAGAVPSGQVLHDHVVPCVGNLGVFVASFPDGQQVLVGDAVVKDGIPMPGELGVDLYNRDNKGSGEHLIQIDAKMSTEMSIAATVLGGAGATISSINGQVLHIPGPRPGDLPDWQCNLAANASNAGCKPTERIRAEIVGDGQSPPPPGSPPPSSPPPPKKGSDCSPLFCAVTIVHVDSVNAVFDFGPACGRTTVCSSAVRRVDAVVRTNGAKNGMEVKSFDDVAGTTPSAGGIHAAAALNADTIDVFVHAGIPFLANLDFDLVSSLQAGFSIGEAGSGTNDFQLRQNLIKLSAYNGGPGSSRIGPIDYNIYLLHADATLLFVKLLGIDFVPPSPPPLSLGALDCDTLLPVSVENALGITDPERNFLFPNSVGLTPGQLAASFNTIPIPSGSGRNVVVNPLSDPRLIFSGVFGSPLNIIDKLVTPFFCLVDTSASNIPLIDANHPQNPIPTSLVAAHPVPDLSVAASPVAPVTPPRVALKPLVVPSSGAGSTLRMCGTHSYSNIDIEGTVIPALVNDPADDGNGRPRCNIGDSHDPNAKAGKLVLVASGDPGDGTSTPVDPTIVVNGSINATALMTNYTGPGFGGGNSGSGHGGGGGHGSTGSGGGTYGDQHTQPYKTGNDFNVPDTEIGTGGAGPGTDYAGGAVALQADSVTLGAGASITADGQPGVNGGSTQCSTGSAAGGGGSGGGILIEAAQLSMGSGSTIHANGGNGGRGSGGGGGGGGGGIVKLIDALTPGVHTDGGSKNVAANAGAAGDDNVCTADSTHPHPAAPAAGSAGVIAVDVTPQAHVKTFPVFWQSNAGSLTFNFRSAATTSASDGRYKVELCAIPRTLTQGQATGGLNFSSLLPTNNAAGDPCGTNPFITGAGWSPAARDLGGVSVTAGSLVDGSITINGGTLGDGYAAAWVAVVRDSGSGLCAFFGFSCPATLPPPLAPDTTLGVDSTRPGATLAAVGKEGLTCSTHAGMVCTRDRGLALNLSAHDDQSGLDRVSCVQTDSGGTTQSCHVTPPSNSFLLTAGDGEKHVHVDVVDKAGNVANSPVVDVTVLLDTTMPTANPLAVSSPDGLNGFYRTAPTFTLSGYDDHGGSGLETGENAYAYRFDDGPESGCTDPCSIHRTDLLPGTHNLYWTTVDHVGNRLFGAAMNRSADFVIDPNSPVVAISSVPAGPDGAGGWFQERPIIVVNAVDGPGESGIGPVTYRLVDSTGTHTFTYSGPFSLGPGTSTLCAHAADLAGNPSASTAYSAPDPCVTYQVDDARPQVVLGIPAVDGANGSYRTTPSVTVNATDASPGSGVNTFYVSLDGTAFQSYIAAQTFTIPSGFHDLRAYALDNSGQRSDTAFAAFKVDTTPPTTVARSSPPAPALAGNGWFRESAQVYLRATDGDQSSGVGAIQYNIDGGAFLAYAGPVIVPEGAHTVNYRSVDLAGTIEPTRSLPVWVDTTPTQVAALAPSPLIWIRVLNVFGPPQAQLNWTLTEPALPNVTSTTVKVRVLVDNMAGDVVRQIDDGTSTVTPGVAFNGSTAWDGHDDTLTGLVPAGVYYYRVVITDAAGNVSMSGESRPIEVRVSVP